MPTLEELVTGAYTSPTGVLSDVDRAKFEEAMLSLQRGEIERQSGDRARAINEATFGRGLGLSTVTRDLQADRERLRQEALSKAAREAFLGAQQAQQAALGQAAQYVTAQRGQALQGQQLAQQASQFKKSLGQQQGLQTQALLGGGLAGLTGAGLKTAGYLHGQGKAPWQTQKPGGVTPGTPGALTAAPPADIQSLLGPTGAFDIPSPQGGLFAPPTMAPFAFGAEPSFNFGGFEPSVSFDPSAFDLSRLDFSGLGGLLGLGTDIPDLWTPDITDFEF